MRFSHLLLSGVLCLPLSSSVCAISVRDRVSLSHHDGVSRSHAYSGSQSHSHSQSHSSVSGVVVPADAKKWPGYAALHQKLLDECHKLADDNKWQDAWGPKESPPEKKSPSAEKKSNNNKFIELQQQQQQHGEAQAFVPNHQQWTRFADDQDGDYWWNYGWYSNWVQPVYTLDGNDGQSGNIVTSHGAPVMSGFKVDIGHIQYRHLNLHSNPCRAAAGDVNNVGRSCIPARPFNNQNAWANDANGITGLAALGTELNNVMPGFTQVPINGQCERLRNRAGDLYNPNRWECFSTFQSAHGSVRLGYVITTHYRHHYWMVISVYPTPN